MTFIDDASIIQGENKSLLMTRSAVRIRLEAPRFQLKQTDNKKNKGEEHGQD